MNNKWPPLKADYEYKDIFNADETGLFYKCLPNKTLKGKGESYSGEKLSKERSSVLLCSSILVEKENHQ
jgi:hypothetical protein